MNCFTLGNLHLGIPPKVMADPEILGRNLNGGVYVELGQGPKSVAVLARSMGTQGFLSHRIADLYAIREAALYRDGDDVTLVPMPIGKPLWSVALVAATFKSGYGGVVKPVVWSTSGAEVVMQIVYKQHSSLNDIFGGEVLECLFTLPNHGFVYVDVLDSMSRNWRYTVYFGDVEGVSAKVTPS